LIALAGLAGAHRAGAIAITGTVTGGATLSASSAGTPTFSLTLNGVDQTASYTLPAQAIDPRGTGAGWNMTVTSTQFKDASGHTFPTTASSITAASNVCGAGSTCTTATNSVSYASLTLPSAPVAPAAVKFFNAAANTGMGKVDVSATVSVAVPANVFAGTYTSTVTVSIVSGP
jgi:acetylornithine deacetylase/succinyl-diaminopimelate desuccinylase-like protein